MPPPTVPQAALLCSCNYFQAKFASQYGKRGGEEIAKLPSVDESRKRVIGIMASILAARKLEASWSHAYSAHFR
jgi:hypothetical protein